MLLSLPFSPLSPASVLTSSNSDNASCAADTHCSYDHDCGRNMAVRCSRTSSTPSTDKKAVVGAGSTKATGGGRGTGEALHHEGRFPGSSAAVQSRPIHQR